MDLKQQNGVPAAADAPEKTEDIAPGAAETPNEQAGASTEAPDPAPAEAAAPSPEAKSRAAKEAEAAYVSAAQARVRAKKQRRFHVGKLAVTAAAMLCMTAFAFALPLRPTVSDAEKRELAKIPAFSVASLLDGSFFAGISTWFSDTVPFRDSLISANARVQHLLGTGGAQAGFHEGVQGDAIPEVPATQETAAPTDAETVSAAPETAAPPATEASAAAETQPAAPTQTQPAATGTTAAAPADETAPTGAAPSYEALGSILVCGNAGYEYYNFVQSTGDRYVSVVNRAASILGEGVQVYAMVIPTSIGVTLDPRVQKKISSDDQQKACAYLESQFASNVRAVPIINTLLAHKDEYIYFRTDHHWTGRGAYYAYVEFCAKKA